MLPGQAAGERLQPSAHGCPAPARGLYGLKSGAFKAHLCREIMQVPFCCPIRLWLNVWHPQSSSAQELACIRICTPFKSAFQD